MVTRASHNIILWPSIHKQIPRSMILSGPAKVSLRGSAEMAVSGVNSGAIFNFSILVTVAKRSL
jgi:hypothetical protein